MPIGGCPRSKVLISSKDWTLDSLLKRGEKFVKVPRVSIFLEEAILHSIIRDHEQKGIPLVIDGLHKHPCWLEEFDLEWFRKNGQQDAKARNVHTWIDVDIPLSELIEKQRAIPTVVTSNETERFYGKDAHCPEPWKRWLNESGVIPHFLAPESSSNLLEVLPEKERVETLMCYLGVGDTFTPCHKDLCASSGQNVMCYTENNGSSFWFMTESSSAPVVAEYFHKLGQELDLESHVITVEELAEGPFKVYIVEQRLGDMVLVPPRSCHQVVNHGGITIKTSWSRMTLAGLTTAFYHELPLYRRVCRSETYRVKETIHQALLHYTKSTPTNAANLRCLINLFDDVLLDEYDKDHKKMPHVLQITAASDSSQDVLHPQDNTRVTCDFCDTDIFQSFFECKKCISIEGDAAGGDPSDELDGLIICPQCYVEGRTCRCGVMTPTQYRAFWQLLLDRNYAMKVLADSGSGRETDTVLNERDLESGLIFSVFRSACLVHKYRKKLQERRGPGTKATRKCSHGRGYSTPPHTLPCASVLICDLCHAGKCFGCILSLGIHSGEAMFLHHRDPTHKTWHRQHKRRDSLADIRTRDLEAEMIGAPCDRRNKLVAIAANFNTCVPLKQNFIKLGWYDKFIQFSSASTKEGEKQAIKESFDHTGGMMNTEPSPMSELSFLLSDEEGSLNPATETCTPTIPDNPNKLPRIVRKRKREVLDCVLIPLYSATESATSESAGVDVEENVPHRHRHDSPFGVSRAVRFLPESTPSDTMMSSPPNSYGVHEQPTKKKVRSSRGPLGLRDVEFETGCSSAFVIPKPAVNIPSIKADIELVQRLQGRIDDLEAENLERNRREIEWSWRFRDLQECVKSLVNFMDKKFPEAGSEMPAIWSLLRENLQIDIDSRPGPRIMIQTQVSTQPHIQEINNTQGQRSLAFDRYTQDIRDYTRGNSANSETELLSPREYRSHPYPRNENEVDHGYSLLGSNLPNHRLQRSNNEWNSEIIPDSQSSQGSSPQLGSQTANVRQEFPQGPHVSPGPNSNDYSHGSRMRSDRDRRIIEYLQSPPADSEN